MQIVILGGGITGMFSAYYLLKDGHAVTIIDKDSPSDQTSAFNSGQLTAAFASAPRIYFNEIFLSYLGRKGAIWISPKQILKDPSWFFSAARKGMTGFEKGILSLSEKSLELFRIFFREESIEVDLIKGVIELYDRIERAKEVAGITNARFVDGNEALEIGYKNFGGGVLFEDGLSVNPAKLFVQLRSKLSQMGVKMILGQEANLNVTQGRVNFVKADTSEVRGDFYLVAAGSRSRHICKMIGYDPKIMPARGLSMIFSVKGGSQIRTPGFFEDYGIGVSPHDSVTMRMTSFFQMVGFNEKFKQSERSWMINTIREHLTADIDIHQIGEGVGYRPCTPDQLPVIGKVPGYSNLFIASGNCRIGVTLAPVTGDIVRSLVNGRELNRDFTQFFDPSRFSN
jgi:D-amino-acid dehydrogenase